MSLFVGNLSPYVQYRDLEPAFRRFGRCNLDLKDGFAFVIYESHRDAERALRALQGRSIYRERPSISWARTQRPFHQRLPAKSSAPPFRRHFQDRDMGPVEQRTRRGGSPEIEKAVDDRKDAPVPGYGFKERGLRDGSREVQSGEVDADGNVAVAEDWKDQNAAADVVPPAGREPRGSSPLDGGRWGEIPSDGSLDRCLIEDEQEYPEDQADRDNEGAEGSEKDPRVKPRISLERERSCERSSRPHDMEDPLNRGRGREPFCYYCGKPGHVKWQCRSRPNVSLFNRGRVRRDGFDARRQNYRGIRGTNGFRRAMGRFRVFEGPRGFHKEIDPGYRVRTLGRQSRERRIHEQVDYHSQVRSRRKRHRSESQSSSQSQERRRKNRKKHHKRSASRERRKRKHSSSSSKSESRSHSQSSSSSHPLSHTHSSVSHSRSSKSYSRSSGSQSHSLSQKSVSASSGERSVSSSSRSVSHSRMSASSHSRSKSRSVSSKSVIRSPSHSRDHWQDSSMSLKSHRLQSHSPAPLKSDSNELHGNSLEHQVRSSKSCSQTGDVGGPIPVATLANAKDIENEEVGPSSNASQPYEEKHILLGTETGADMIQGKHRGRSSGVKEGVKGVIAKDAVDASCSWRVQKEEAFGTKDISGRKSEFLEAPAPGRFLAKEEDSDSKLSLSKLGSSSQNSEPEAFGAARFWPWKAILCRRLKRVPITIPNYERRKAQNKEFHIVDKFVRSSSGWWEEPE